jgi:hypothetical protein
MRKTLAVLILLGLVAITLPMTAAAMGLDVEAKGGAGIGLGSTDNKDISGSPRIAAGGGVGIDFYAVTLGPVDLGLSAGVEYSHSTFHYTWSDFAIPGTDQTADATYGYLNIPVSLVCRLPITESVQVILRAGGFIGFLEAGYADLTYDPQNVGFGLVNGRQTLDKSNSIMTAYGLHFTAGADIALGSGFILAPWIQFDMGLTDNTKNTQPLPGTFNDNLWSLTAMVGIKYKVL